MATADLLVIISDLILWRIRYYYFPRTFLDLTPICSLIYVILRAATDYSVWFTVTFSFDRFVAICCQNLKTKYCTVKTADMVLGITSILFCFKNVPFYFTFEPGEKIDNVPWNCEDKPNYYTEPGWVRFDWFDTVLTPFIPFTLIILLNTLTVRHILLASRVRMGLRGQNTERNYNDPEMENRKKSVILLFTISGSFILLWLMYVMDFLYYIVAGVNPIAYNDVEYLFKKLGVMLVNLNCCTNTLIYCVTQSKFREQFNSLMKYPFAAIIQFVQNRNN
ncbi:probable G-protein coupled receptor 139 [Scyliorhinus canicula]|uniref:probable G-protein coupled receptor 139 n=1 Tax=Scyliorhinus canicula TaxID=7830 RepID=UPI0018F78609|nr:probable G-protein coupled receptor 139 [Scyliorhinus canicula]